MEKYSLTRWLLTPNEGVLGVREREVSRYMPLNRLVSEVGFYMLDFIEAGDHVYYYTSHEEEIDQFKSEILVGRFDTVDGQMMAVDMTEVDFEFMHLFEVFFDL